MMAMDGAFIYYDYLNIYDDQVFTEKRANDWKMHMLECYADVFEGLKNKLDYDSPVCFNLSLSLLDEVIVDAIIGMRKIVHSKNNCVDDPNTFKIAAYLSYWWLRHKPVYLHYPVGFRLEDVDVADMEGVPEDEQRKKRQELCWKLKHINELVAVQIVMTMIFDFEKVVCDSYICNKVKAREKEKFNFVNFEDMRKEIFKKLIYYFSYRAITPKVIEHTLEAYTFHPAWGLTGKHWNEGDEKK